MQNFGDFFSEKEIDDADSKIRELAAYEVSKGKTVSLADIKEFMSMQVKILNKFNYFKYLIQNNEATIEELTNIVKNRYGPFPNKVVDDSNIDLLLQDIFRSNDQQLKSKEEDLVISNFADKILNSLMKNKSQVKVISQDIYTKNKNEKQPVKRKRKNKSKTDS